MKRLYRHYLEDILESVELIEDFTEGMDFEKFRGDVKTRDAVVKRLEIIGEAAKNVPKDIRDKYPELPWSKMARMRDKLTHEYFGIRFDIVWKAVKNSLPGIKSGIKKILKNLEG